MGDIESDFADMDAGKTPPVRERDQKGKFQPSGKPADKPIEKPVEKPADAPADEVVPPEKPDGKPTEPIKPVKAADLRAAYDGLKKKLKDELEPEIQKLRSKVQEYESRQPEDTAPVLAKMKAIEERNAALEKHIEYVDYAQSKEFVSKYQQPYREAWTDAINEFRELTVKQPNGVDEDGNPKFDSRPADENDLLRLANLKLSDMDAAAHDMFGPSASRAINHIQNLKKLSFAQNKALEEAKAKAGEWRSQRGLENQQRSQSLASAWTEINKNLQEKFPKAFQPEEANADDAAAHTKGFALADLLFLGNDALTPEQVEALPAGFRETVKSRKPLTEVQKVQLHALSRLKIANHDRKVVQLKKANERIAELEKSLAEYEKSEPTAGKAGAGTPSSGKSWDEEVADELKAMDK